MSQLRDRILASRQTWVEVGTHKFLVRRPSELQLLKMQRTTSEEFTETLLRESVVGWDGVLEEDLVTSGASDPVPFDREVFMTWVEDRPDVWQPVIESILKGIESARAKADPEDGAKN
jgi:hypothetical protein